MKGGGWAVPVACAEEVGLETSIPQIDYCAFDDADQSSHPHQSAINGEIEKQRKGNPQLSTTSQSSVNNTFQIVRQRSSAVGDESFSECHKDITPCPIDCIDNSRRSASHICV